MQSPWSRFQGHQSGTAQEIEVRPVGSHSTAGDEIARRTLNVLRWNTSLPANVVKVKVQSGWVTLLDTVEWYCQREPAARVMRDMTVSAPTMVSPLQIWVAGPMIVLKNVSTLKLLSLFGMPSCGDTPMSLDVYVKGQD